MIILVVVSVAFVLTVTFRLRRLERRMLFPAPVISRTRLAELALEQGAREITVVTEDSVSLYGWHIPARGEQVLLWFEGNSMSVGMRPGIFRQLHDLGFDVVHFNYRGYPGSPGRPSEKGLRADARAAWHFASRIAPTTLVFGKSLGGAVAVGLAAEVGGSCSGLVVESSFSNVLELAAMRVPRRLARWLLVSRFDSLSLASRVRCEVLVLHGDADGIVPVEHAVELAAAFTPPARLLRFSTAGHDDDLLVTPEGVGALRELVARESRRTVRPDTLAQEPPEP